MFGRQMRVEGGGLVLRFKELAGGGYFFFFFFS
jgi:hypothetical protein